MTTLYETAIETLDIILGEEIVIDVIGTLLKGLVVGFMCDGMCDIQDIRELFGSKYDEGIAELLAYAKMLPEYNN